MSQPQDPIREKIEYFPLSLNSNPFDPPTLAHNLNRDDLRAIAGLIIESAPELFHVMFGTQAMDRLIDLIPRSHNRFSHRYLHIAACNHQVVGVAVLVPAVHLKDQADYHTVLHLGQRLWLKLLQRMILDHVLQHQFPAGSFYISNLAVAAEFRNQGIGRQLLLHCLAAARQPLAPQPFNADSFNSDSFTPDSFNSDSFNSDSFNSDSFNSDLINPDLHNTLHSHSKNSERKIFISVDIKNVRAKKLYESLEFQVVATRAIRGFGLTVGSQVLCRSIPQHLG